MANAGNKVENGGIRGQSKRLKSDRHVGGIGLLTHRALSPCLPLREVYICVAGGGKPRSVRDDHETCAYRLRTKSTIKQELNVPVMIVMMALQRHGSAIETFSDTTAGTTPQPPPP